jgi:hypothetical protein
MLFWVKYGLQILKVPIVGKLYFTSRSRFPRAQSAMCLFLVTQESKQVTSNTKHFRRIKTKY